MADVNDDDFLTEGEPYPVQGYLAKHADIPVAATLANISTGDDPPILGGGIGGNDSGNTTPPKPDITNMTPQQGQRNPYECHYFTHGLRASYSEGGTHVSWHMTGGYPLDLSIDQSGTIKGSIAIWNVQPMVNCSPPSPIRLDGSNWRENGRPNVNQWVFTFYAYTIFDYVPPPPPTDGSTIVKPGTGGIILPTYKEGRYKSSLRELRITVPYCRDLDPLIFAYAYMYTGKTAIKVNKYNLDPCKELFIIKHNLNVAGKEYTLKEFDAYTKAHPAITVNCPNIVEFLEKIMRRYNKS